MSLYSLPPLIGSVLCLLLGIFVFLKNKKAAINVSFALTCFSVFIWLGGYTVAYLVQKESIAVFFCRFACTGAMFTAPTFYHLTISFLEKGKREKRLAVLFYGVMLAITPFSMTSPYFLSGVYKYFWGYYSKAGLLHPFYLVIFFTIFIRAFLLLYVHYRERRKLSPLKATQIRYLFIAYLTALLGAVDYIPKYGVEFYPFGFIFEIAFAPITAYAIVRHRLMDINVAITQGVAYSVMAIIVAGSYIGLMVGADKIFTGFTGYNPTFAHSILFIGVFFVLLYVLPRMKIQAVQITRKTLFRGRYDYQQELSETTRTIPTILNLEQLGSYILSKIKDTMKVEKLALFVHDEDKHSYRLSTSLGLSTDISKTNCIAETSALIVLLKGTGKPIVQEELEKRSSVSPVKKEAIVKQLSSLLAELLLPLMLRGDLKGFITLSTKQSQEMFTDEDLSLLTTLANQVALTVEYIKAIDKISSERRYVGLGKAAMRMAHDIKNPLVPLKTFLQVLPDKYPQEFAQMAKADEEFTGSLYQSAIDGVNRINLLVERALHFARHPLPQFALVALNELLDNVLMQEDISIKKAKVQLQKQYTSDEKTIEADAEQLIELFSNLISNAVDAMENTSTKKMTISIQPSGNYITVGIADTGCGISQDKIDSIFDPFITYKHKGSGLGLAIVKRIVEEHHGTVAVNSEPEQGTSFQITLPKKQEKTTAEETASEKVDI